MNRQVTWQRHLEHGVRVDSEAHHLQVSRGTGTGIASWVIEESALRQEEQARHLVSYRWGMKGLDLPDEISPPHHSYEVDIYFAAASGECNRTVSRDCEIYRVTVTMDSRGEPGFGAAERVVPELHNGCGFVQPALSPDGRHLAVVEKCYDSGETATEQHLYIRVLDGGAMHYVEGGSASFARPHFPTFLDDDRALYHKTNRDSSAISGLWMTNRERSWFPQTSATLPGVSEEQDYADVSVNPRDRSRLVTFGGAENEEIPKVHDLSGGSVESFEMPGERFTSCHHPSWSPEGDRVLCNRQARSETIHDEFGSVYEVRMLYWFRRNSTSGTWRNITGHAFDPWHPLRLHEELGDAFPSSYDGLTFTYKYAEWCGSEDFLVATLFVTDEWGNMLTSRVLLIRHMREGIPLAEPEYYDLCSRMTSASERPMQAVYSTCSRRRFS